MLLVKIGVHTVSCGEDGKMFLAVRESPRSKGYEIKWITVCSSTYYYLNNYCAREKYEDGSIEKCV
jgi:hypothetical protein